MNESTQKKSLVNTNNKSIFCKIKNLFMNILQRNKSSANIHNIDENKNTNDDKVKQNESFKEYIKNIENEDTKLLKILNQYRSGEIEEKDLTPEQVQSLCKLFDEKIESLRKSNEIRKQKLIKYRKSV